MTTRKLDEQEWHKYFDESARRGGEQEGDGRRGGGGGRCRGSVRGGKSLASVGITYDQKDKLLEVALEGIDPVIRHPQEMHVNEFPAMGSTSWRRLDPNRRKRMIQIAHQ